MLGTLDKINVLRKVDLFRGLSFEDLSTIARIAETVRFDGGKVLFRQGDAGDCLYVIAEGCVTIVLESKTGGEPVTTLRRHGFFGEMALLDELLRSATALVAAPTTMLRIGKNDFHELLREFPSLGFELLRLLSARVRALQKRDHDEE
jgi:CRP-like cAMP-binding protein